MTRPARIPAARQPRPYVVEICRDRRRVPFGRYPSAAAAQAACAQLGGWGFDARLRDDNAADCEAAALSDTNCAIGSRDAEITRNAR